MYQNSKIKEDEINKKFNQLDKQKNNELKEIRKSISLLKKINSFDKSYNKQLSEKDIYQIIEDKLSTKIESFNIKLKSLSNENKEYENSYTIFIRRK